MSHVGRIHAEAEPLDIVWFAGGGGSSAGFKARFGRDPDYALNHDADALRMHEVNHPGTRHLLADAFAAGPMDLEPGRPLRSMWFSPDCTHHSKARGQAPKSDRIRGLAWCMIPWAKLRRPSVILLENVEEFQDYGPLFRAPHPMAGHPDPAHKGRTFRRLIRRLEQCDYTVTVRELVTANYGGPTTRKRLFLVATQPGVDFHWPEPTHAPRQKAAAMGLPAWKSAASCIDWSERCPSIFMTQAEAKAEGLNVKRPLVALTQRRIAKGIERYVIGAAEPFLVHLTHHGERRAHPLGEPAPTITGANRGEMALTAPTVVPITHGSWSPDRADSVADPLRTVTGANRGEYALAAAALVRTDMHQSNASCVFDAEDPLRTITSAGGHALAAIHLGRQFGSNVSGRDAAEPLATVMGDGAGGKSNVVAAYLSQHNGDRVGRGADEPLTTLTGRGTQQKLVAACLDRAFTQSRPTSAAEPLRTVTGNPHDGLIACSLMSYFRTGVGSGAGEPLRTVTGEDRHALLGAWLEQANTDMVGRDGREPLSTIVGKGCTQRLVEARLQQLGAAPGSRRRQVVDFLWAHAGAPTEAEWLDPLATLGGRLKFGLVVLSGVVFEIADIGMRMLTPRELFNAQSFPADYIIDRDIHGRPISKTAATLMCGNAVPPVMAEALYTAVFPRSEPERVAA